MKVGFLASVRGKNKYEKEYKAILSYLEKRGHDIVQNELTPEALNGMPYPEREKRYLAFYEKLMHSDVIIAECSLQSIPVGYALAYLRDHGKPIIILSVKSPEVDLNTTKGLFSSIENIIILEYTLEDVNRTLDSAFTYIEPHLDKRFTIIFPSDLFSKIEDVAQKKKLPKAVFIRQLVEKELTQEADA